MFLEIAAGAFLVSDWIYHRMNDKGDRPPAPAEIQIPRSEDGTIIPIIYGKCRVRAPILARCFINSADTSSANARMFFVLGLAMDDGNALSRVLGIWDGEHKIKLTGTQTGNGGFESPLGAAGYGKIETLNGNPSQTLVDDAGTSTTWAGHQFLIDDVPPLTAAQVSGYRGFISAYLFEILSGWVTPVQIPAYSFEASSYASSSAYPGVGFYGQIGEDSNPINVIYDLLCSQHGRLGLLPSQIDMPSFQAAAFALVGESHGYSRAVESGQPAEQIIQEVLEQIDGVLYDNQTDGKLHVKLIRPDYDVRSIPQINTSNCDRLESLAIGGWTGIPNKIRVVYADRSNDYRDNSVTAQNSANAVGQDGQVREVQINYPGCTSSSLASNLAARELAWRSRPMIKCRAMVSRDFLRVNPGDPVLLTWTNPDIAGLVFRVAAVSRGTDAAGLIGLDLIQDAFYVWRQQAPREPGIGALDTGNLQVGLG